MTTVQRRSAAAMPAIQHAPSNGDLLNLPQGMVPTGATLAGAPSAGAPAPIMVRHQHWAADRHEVPFSFVAAVSFSCATSASQL